MSLLQKVVTNEHGAKPPRIVVYGKEGVGKTPFAGNSTKAILMDLEGSADYYDFNKAKPKNFAACNQIIDALLNEEHDYKTLGLDTLDCLERFIHDEICISAKANSISDKSNGITAYGNGYILACNKFIAFRDKLDELRDKKNMSIILIAHTLIKSRSDPIDGDYEEHTIKLHDKFAAAAIEWADAVLLAKKKMINSDKSPNGKIESNETILYSSSMLGARTKNRLALPKEVPCNWNSFISAIGTNTFNNNN
jgi:hypothetical protein